MWGRRRLYIYGNREGFQEPRKSMLTLQWWEGIRLATWESISDRGSSRAKILKKGTTEQLGKLQINQYHESTTCDKGLAGSRGHGGEWLYPDGPINQVRGFRTSFWA